MTAYSLLEIAIVALIVAACAVKAFGRFFPKTRMQLQGRLAQGLDRPGRAAWLRGLGRRLGSATPDAGCGSGCSTCGSCGPTDVKPIQIKRPSAHGR